MAQILGISGSLRKGSFNSALLRAAADLAPKTIEIGSISKIPLYNSDVETTAFPQSVSRLKEKLQHADGLLIVTPEYNNSMPGVLKNAIDWLSRPSDGIGNVFQNKPVAVAGASPGGFGTMLSQNAWLTVFRSLGARQWSAGRLLVSGANSVFDESGDLVDAQVRERLVKFVNGFIGFCG